MDPQRQEVLFSEPAKSIQVLQANGDDVVEDGAEVIVELFSATDDDISVVDAVLDAEVDADSD